MSGASDAVLYDTCKSEGRIMVTLDHDFGEVLRFPPEDTAGIIILECRGRLSPTTILARVNELLALLATQVIDGELWIVEPGRVRIHDKRQSE